MRKSFNEIEWKLCYKQVAKLQEKIVVAWNKGEKTKVEKLQRILTNCMAARALAVKRVVTNDGGDTPGIDGITWNTVESRTKAIELLKNQEDYKPMSLKRVFIPKGDGKTLRGLSIPTIFDRAMQALYLMALDPIAECTTDKHSYGFRKNRGCHDAIETCFIILSERHRARYILNADIKGYFDNINHEWITKNIPMNKQILQKWLKMGHIDLKKGGRIEVGEQGVPQGGVISPTIANMVLDGLDSAIQKSVKHLHTRTKGIRYKPKVNLIRYADDFIVTADSKEIIEKWIIPEINKFLKVRGVELNMVKTTITSITEGFEFLGFQMKKVKDPMRKSGEIFLTTPSRKSIMKITDKIKKSI